MTDETLTPDYYVTQGTKFGRVLRCNEPFMRGDAVYYFSFDLDDWEQVSGKPLSEDELAEAIEDLYEQRMQWLYDTVEQYQHKKFVLLDHGDNIYEIRQLEADDDDE